MTAVHQWWAGVRATAPAPPTGNVFQFRGLTDSMSYPSVYLADAPDAVHFGGGDWANSSNPGITHTIGDTGLPEVTMSVTTTGTAVSATTHEPAADGYGRYWEIAILQIDPATPEFSIGLCGSAFVSFNSFLYAGGAPGTGYTATHYESDGQLRKNSGVVLTGAPLAVGDIVGVVANSPLVSNAARFYLNGVFVGTTDINAQPVSVMVTQKAA